MPPVFVIGANGQGELVNYRVSGRYIIVDRLFTEAELRMGDRRSEQRVRISGRSLLDGFLPRPIRISCKQAVSSRRR
jgi:hypothetical protein